MALQVAYYAGQLSGHSLALPRFVLLLLLPPLPLLPLPLLPLLLLQLLLLLHHACAHLMLKLKGPTTLSSAHCFAASWITKSSCTGMYCMKRLLVAVLNTRRQLPSMSAAGLAAAATRCSKHIENIAILSSVEKQRQL
jgi:hypothetical protein